MANRVELRQPFRTVRGVDGATFTPSVSEDGYLSWSNDKGLDNPEPAYIKGEKGDRFSFDDFTEEERESLKGDKGDAFKYEDFTPEQLESLKGKDYILTDEDKEDIAKLVEVPSASFEINKPDMSVDFVGLLELENGFYIFPENVYYEEIDLGFNYMVCPGNTLIYWDASIFTAYAISQGTLYRYERVFNDMIQRNIYDIYVEPLKKTWGEYQMNEEGAWGVPTPETQTFNTKDFWGWSDMLWSGEGTGFYLIANPSPEVDMGGFPPMSEFIAPNTLCFWSLEQQRFYDLTGNKYAEFYFDEEIGDTAIRFVSTGGGDYPDGEGRKY